MTRYSIPNDLPIHAVRAWSEDVNDETPLCGADKNDPQVWNKRTIYHVWVTCADCRKIINKGGKYNAAL